ncbi:MAG: Transketolase, thiamine diphosphate binding protein [uncultured bacterium]|nr:MAG: Transketolase, thiamine diphosphate binding protein [uncultured bacterium]
MKKINGHDFSQLKSGLTEISQVKNQPAVLIAETIRGKGVSFMEQSVLYHAKTLTEEEYKKAREEIEKNDENN